MSTASKLVCLLLLACAAPRCGLRAAEPFRWGADQEGGGPYIFHEDDNPERLVGFEVDLAAEIGKLIGRPDQFVQCNWDSMLLTLERGNIDLAMNGFEYMPDRAERYLASLPYYIYELGLCVRREDRQTQTWDDLSRPGTGGRRKRIGVLEGSAADRYATKNYDSTCEIVRYPSSAEAFLLVDSGQLDATIQDVPILHFYLRRLQRYPALAIAEGNRDEGFYVLYARPGDEAFIDQVNSALRTLYEDGTMRAIYERYSIWNETQQRLPEIWNGWSSQLQARQRDTWQVLAGQLPILIKASGVTVALALLSMPLAILIGLFAALVRSWGSPNLGGGAPEGWAARLIRVPVTLYVEVVRGTPLAFQLFVVYFVLPRAGIRLDEFWAGVIALAVNYSAYEAEIFRLGLQAIPKGQMEAALSLGMPRLLAIRRIILPQAVRLVIPATANDFIALFKDTAVCSVIAVEELSKKYSMGAKDTALYLEMAAMASVLYLLMSYPLSLLAAWLERTLKRP